MSTVASERQCPVCDAELIPGAAACMTCGTELSLFEPPADIALDCYNEGLDLARAGDRDGAECKMRAAIAADPAFVDAHIVLGKLVAQRGDASDLEQAIALWERARSAGPSTEQSQKLEHCIETARARLVDAGHEDDSARRSNYVVLAGIGGMIAAVCGVGGYLLRPILRSGDSASSAAKVQSQPVSERASPPLKDPVVAISQAISRPDITVGRNGKSLVLHGKVQTEAEKRAILASAAFAAGTQPGLIDGSDLRVAPAYTPISAARVQHMLNKFVNRASTGWDPLRYARLSVSGGSGKNALKVTGTISDRRASAEIVQLIKEVYPSANPADVSGLVLRPIARRPVRPVRRWRRRAESAPGHEPTKLAADDQPEALMAQPPGKPTRRDEGHDRSPAATYTVRPGDTIYGITHKYGQVRSQWRELWDANRRTVHKPGSIPSGTKLTLPASWKAP